MTRNMSIIAVLLLAVYATGCMYAGSRQSPDTHYTAIGIEGGGQRSIAPEHARMWEQEFSEQEWLNLLCRREHQPMAMWRGVRTGSVSEARSGMGYGGLMFRDSISHVLEHQLSCEDLMQKHPCMFLKLFDSQDPETVLTGAFPYRRAGILGDTVTPEDAARIAQGLRDKLLTHRDVRARWAAVQTLGANRWLTPADVERGLNDETNEIRVTTAFWLHVMQEPNEEILYNDDGKLVKGDPQEVREMTERYIELAPILLEHLNDTNFFVRRSSAWGFRHLFRRWVDRGEGSKTTWDSPLLPEKIDWVRSDWRTREDTQKLWKDWWAEHGDEALRGAHPTDTISDGANAS